MGAVYIDPTTDTAYIKFDDTYLAEEVKDAWGIRHGILRKHNEEIKHINYTSCGKTGSQKITRIAQQKELFIYQQTN